MNDWESEQVQSRINKLQNLTIASIDVDTLNDNRTASGVLITTECGKKFLFEHDQECCEEVLIYDVQGDVSKLAGQKLTRVDIECNDNDPEDTKDADLDRSASYTWSTVTFKTSQDTVIIRWFGSSNGWYGEEVDLREVT